MRAYLIDPVLHTMVQVEHDGSLENMYELLGCDIVEAVRIGPLGDAVFVDEEGLFKEDQEFFSIDLADNPNPLAGRGLVLGCDSEGNSTDPLIGLYRLAEHLHFLTRIT